MTKQRYKGPRDQIEQTHQAEDQNDYLSCHQSDFPKMIDQGGPQKAEDSLEEGDSLGETEDSLGETEDSPEVEDTREEEECHLEDHREAVGDHPRSQYHKPIKES